MPKVTAIVPNYNHSRFLDKRISSVLQQTFEDMDVILMDDASTDNSAAILDKYAAHPKVRAILINEKNTGIPFKQWNKGVAQAAGEYIWMAESDDYADLRLLERLTAQLDRDPRIGVAYCQSLAVSAENEVLHSLEDWTADLDPAHWKNDYVNDGPAECARYVTLKCTIPNASGAVFRRSVYQQVGGADEDFRLSGDWMLWAKLLLESNVAFISEPLNYFRMHASTVRSSSTKSTVALREAIRIFEYIDRRLTVPQKIREQAFERLLSRWIVELSKGRLAIGPNWQLYRSLRQIDNNVGARLVGRVTGRFRKQFAAAK